MDEMTQLRATIARLRAPDGCPWDREQTHATLRGKVIEEAYETVEAIDENDDAHLCEELGDLLLQVVLHAQIAEEDGRFTLDDIAATLNAKLIRRHPHVFGATALADSDAVLKQWDDIKRSEKNNANPSRLGEVAAALPSLLHAEKITTRAARVGFDWDSPAPVLEKIREELAETEAALAHGDADHIEEELGDLLFAVVNLARKIRVEPETALRRATGKFIRRFQAMEAVLEKRNRKLEDCTLAEMDAVWDEIKNRDKKTKRKD